MLIELWDGGAIESRELWNAVAAPKLYTNLLMLLIY